MILVTGSTGMLGRVLCRTLEGPYEVSGTSKRGLGGSERCDLTVAADVRELFEKKPAELVIHTAAYSDVDGCERDPKLAYESNALAVKNLAALCGQKKIPWIHVSTDYVFDGCKREPYREGDLPAPKSIYGLTKWIGEFYAARSIAPCALVRTSWLFGAGNPRTFVNAIASRLGKEDALSVLDNQTTAPTSVKDLSLALKRITESMLKQGAGKRWNEIFHVCNRGGATHLEMAKAIRDLLGRPKVRVDRTDPGCIPNRIAIRPKYSVMDTGKFENTFGMKMRSWEESLREYVTESLACVS